MSRKEEKGGIGCEWEIKVSDTPLKELTIQHKIVESGTGSLPFFAFFHNSKPLSEIEQHFHRLNRRISGF
jgi:hypothetical protein